MLAQAGGMLNEELSDNNTASVELCRLRFIANYELLYIEGPSQSSSVARGGGG